MALKGAAIDERIRQQTSAHTAAYVSTYGSIRQQIRQHPAADTAAYGSIRE